MTSFWQEWKEKIDDRLHTVVDRALENSSVALYDQSLRDMEAYLGHLGEAAVSMKAAAEGNKRRLAQYQAEAEILDTRLNQLLAEGQAEQVQKVQQALNIKRQQIADAQAQIERQEGQHAALVYNLKMLKEQLQMLQGERGSVVALVALAKAQRTIGSIEYTLGGLASLGGDSEIGAMAGHILQRLNEAEARLALVDAEVAQAATAIEEAQVEEQLVERRHRLGLVTEEGQETQEEEAAETPKDITPQAESVGSEEIEDPPATPES